MGIQNNPPDMMVKGGDAIEIKKAGTRGGIALNSSSPKDRLYREDPMLTQQCRDCDGGAWEAKGLFYGIGSAEEGRIKPLFNVFIIQVLTPFLFLPSYR